MGYELHSPGDEAESSSFHVSTFDMGQLREVMFAAGLLDPSTPLPTWPRAPEGYWKRAHANEDPTEADRAYETAVDQLRSGPADRPGTVPLWKFGSNDLWWVTAEECELLADGLEAFCVAQEQQPVPMLDPEERAWVRQFISYCRHCARHQGFEVA